MRPDSRETMMPFGNRVLLSDWSELAIYIHTPPIKFVKVESIDVVFGLNWLDSTSF